MICRTLFTFDPAALSGAMASMQTIGDPLDNFFQRMPPPVKNSASWMTQVATNRVKNACQLFVIESHFRPSTDPDAASLLQDIRSAETQPFPAQYVLHQLCVLAVTRKLPDDDKTRKARYLRFCRWIGQGRKDETACFGASNDTSPIPRVSKAFLPESPAFAQCAECGKEGATNSAVNKSSQVKSGGRLDLT
jgi:hypothetical protein